MNPALSPLPDAASQSAERRKGLLVALVALAGLALLLVGLIFANLRSAAERSAADGWIDHTTEVQLAAVRALSALREVEGSGGGYAVTLDPEFLVTYDAARRQVHTELDVLARLTADNPEQQARLSELATVGSARMAANMAVVDRARRGDTDGARALVTSSRGRLLMARFTALLGAVIAEETRLLDERRNAAAAAANRQWLYTWALAAAGIAALLAAAAAFYTAQRAWQRARRADEATRIAGLLDVASENFVALDREFQIIFINAAAIEKDGRPASALVGRSHWEVWPASVGTVVESAYRRCMADREPVNLVHRYGYPTNDQDLWLDIRAYPTDDGIGIFFRNVTKARQAEAARAFLAQLAETIAPMTDPQAMLAAASEALGRHLDAGRVGFAAIDPTGAWSVVERDWTDGSMPSAAGRWRIAELVTPVFKAFERGQTNVIRNLTTDSRTEPHAAIPEVERSAMLASIDVPLVREGSFCGIFYVNAAGARDWTDGEVALVETVAQRMFAALEAARTAAIVTQSEQRLRAVFDNMALGMSRVAFDGERLLEVNAAFCTLTGYSRDELEGTSWVAITHPADIDIDLVPFRRMAAGEIDSYDVEKRYIRKDGSHVWVRLTLSLVRDAAGRPDFEICVAEDISERRADETRRAFLLNLSDRLRETERPTLVVAQELGRALAVSRAGCTVADDSGMVVTLADEWTDGSVAAAIGEHILTDFGGFVFDELRAGRTVVIDDTIADPRTADNSAHFLAMEARAVISVPVMREGRLVAIVFADDREPRRWTPDEVRLVERAAERCWGAVERDRAGEALRASEARFRATADAVPGLLHLSTDDGRNLYVNQGYSSFTGLPAEALLGEGWSAVVHADDRESAVAAWREAVATDTPVATECRIRRHDGAWRWHAARAVRARLLNGSGTWVGVAIDVHDRKLAEDAIAVAEARLRLALRAAGMFAWETDLTTNETFWGEGTAHVLGIPEPDLPNGPGNGVFYVAAHEKARLDAEFEIVAATRGATFAVEYVGTDGRTWRAESGVAYAADGTPERIYGITRDVSAKRAQEAELQRRVNEAVATRETALAQLHEVQKLETIGQMTGGVAHDFNNLLTPIVGVLDMLQRRQIGDDRAQRLIAGAAQSAERARLLVQRLLSFARRAPLQIGAVDIAGLLEGVRELVARAVGPTVALGIEVAPDLPPARIDANQLELALLNLAINARDAMPGGGRLDIRAALRTATADQPDAPDDHICITVADSGTGMDAETLRRAIEPFYTSKGVGHGTGLGLSMVHGLCAQSGGRLVMTSTPGKGTTAEMWLPLATACAVSPEKPAPRPLPVAHRGTVLLVDDEALVRDTTAAMIAEFGYDVLQAGSGPEALAILRDSDRIDLLVTDFQMPGMTGAELGRLSRAMKPALPVLIISGYSRADEIGEEFIRLDKPFRQIDLADRLGDLTGADGKAVRRPTGRKKNPNP